MEGLLKYASQKTRCQKTRHKKSRAGVVPAVGTRVTDTQRTVQRLYGLPEKLAHRSLRCTHWNLGQAEIKHINPRLIPDAAQQLHCMIGQLCTKVPASKPKASYREY
eukprot:1366505-Rhodomonas_salina.1